MNEHNDGVKTYLSPDLHSSDLTTYATSLYVDFTSKLELKKLRIRK